MEEEEDKRGLELLLSAERERGGRGAGRGCGAEEGDAGWRRRDKEDDGTKTDVCSLTSVADRWWLPRPILIAPCVSPPLMMGNSCDRGNPLPFCVM